MAETLTACVIVRDEERRLPACLASIAFCDEVVVVDSGSADRSLEIARAAGARTVENPWPGFAAQRNVALDHARGDWILEIDADERVTPDLAAEIRSLLADPPAWLRMAAIPMRDIFLGRALGPSARYPRYRHRLFRRGAFRHDESRTVHEGLWPDGPTEALAGELEHLLASSWSEALRDTRAYARLDASQLSGSGVGRAPFGVILRPAAKFAYRTFLYGAWRDGWRGVAKVALECAGDSLAALHAIGRPGAGPDEGSGAEPPRLGPVRLLGIGLGQEASARLAGWLEEAGQAGADVALIGAVPSGTARIRSRPLARNTPAEFVRALDAEEQIRPIDALVLAGRREHLLLRAAPRALRGAVEPLDASRPAAAAVAAVQTQTRSPETT